MVKVEYTFADGRKFNSKVDPEATFENLLTAWDPFATVFLNDKEAYEIIAKWIGVLGLGFHPDNDGADYVDGKGQPSFTTQQAAQYNRDITKAFELIGDRVYDIGAEMFEILQEGEVGNA